MPEIQLPSQTLPQLIEKHGWQLLYKTQEYAWDCLCGTNKFSSTLNSLFEHTMFMRVAPEMIDTFEAILAVREIVMVIYDKAIEDNGGYEEFDFDDDSSPVWGEIQKLVDDVLTDPIKELCGDFILNNIHSNFYIQDCIIKVYKDDVVDLSEDAKFIRIDHKGIEALQKVLTAIS